MTQETLYTRCSVDTCEQVAAYKSERLCTRHYLHRYYRANKDAAKARARAAYDRDPQKAKDRARAHYQATDKDRRKAMSREWARSHPEYRVVKEARRRSRKAANGVRRFTAADWRRVVNRHGGRCFYCSAVAKLTLDHVVPISRGGWHAEGNIVPACQPCNLSKGARLLAEWRLLSARR